MNGTGRKRIVVTDSDQYKMNEVIQGRWSVSDLIESEMDETSVSAHVGSGTDRAIGMVRPTLPFQDDKLEKIFQEFEDYLKKTSKAATTSEAHKFAECRAWPESVESKLIARIRGKK